MKRRLVTMMTSIAIAIGGCEWDETRPVGTATPTSPTPSLTWVSPPLLETAPGCAAFAETTRATAETWMRLEIERARRHVREVGVAIPPSAASSRTTTPSWLRDGVTTARRDRVVLADGLLAVVAHDGVNFVAANPDDTMRQLARVTVHGEPWGVARIGPDGHLVVVSRHEGPDGPLTTITRLDPSGLAEEGAPVSLLESHTVPGALELVAQHGSKLRLVTQGRLKLSDIPTWPEALEPTASLEEQASAFAELEARNLERIGQMKLGELLPEDVVQRCSDGMFPGTYLGAGWLLISDFETKQPQVAPIRRLPVLGEYAASSADADALVILGTNWPYAGLLPDGQEVPVQTEVHRIEAGGDAYSQRLDGAPVGSRAVVISGEHVVVTTAASPSFVSRNFAPRGVAHVTSLSRTLAVIDTLEEALGEDHVANAVFSSQQAYLLPEGAGASIVAIAWDDKGKLSLAGTIPGVQGQRLVPVGDSRLASIEPMPELPDTAVQVVVYDVSSGVEPFPVGPPLQVRTSILRPEGDTTLAVDLGGVMLLDNDRLLAVPLQVATADSSGYWFYSPRLNLFRLDSSGPAAIGQIDHEGLHGGDEIVNVCDVTASDQRFTGAAVHDGVLYSASTLGILAHDLAKLHDSPLATAAFDHSAGCETAETD